MNYSEILNILYQRFPLEICRNIMKYMVHPTAVILKEAAFTVEEWGKHLRLNIDDEQVTYHMIYGQLGCSEGWNFEKIIDNWLDGWEDPQKRDGWLMKDVTKCHNCGYFRETEEFELHYKHSPYGWFKVNPKTLCDNCYFELCRGPYLQDGNHVYFDENNVLQPLTYQSNPPEI